MKNLFSINRTEDTHSVRPDSTPFDAEHIDSALEEQLRQASDAAFEAFDQPLTPPRGRQAGGHGSWQLGLGLLLTIIAIVPVFLWRDTLFSGDRAYFAWILLALLIAGGVLVSWAYRIQKKTMMQETRERQEANASGQNAAAVETAMKEMTRLQRQARTQLHVPDDALELDVFPFVYEKRGDRTVGLDRNGRFQSLLVLAWRQGNDLCLSDGTCNLRIPTEAIRGRVTCDRPFVVDMWLKEERPGEGRFKPYHLKKTGLLAVKGRTWYCVMLGAPGGDSYELLIPCYDLPQLEKLVSIPEPDARTEDK